MSSSVRYGCRICDTETSISSLHLYSKIRTKLPLSHLALADEVTDKRLLAVASHTQDCVEVQKRRMELFHYEYQHEQQQYKSNKKKKEKEDEKLNAILKYTRDIFKRF